MEITTTMATTMVTVVTIPIMATTKPTMVTKLVNSITLKEDTTVLAKTSHADPVEMDAGMDGNLTTEHKITDRNSRSRFLLKLNVTHTTRITMDTTTKL